MWLSVCEGTNRLLSQCRTIWWIWSTLLWDKHSGREILRQSQGKWSCIESKFSGFIIQGETNTFTTVFSQPFYLHAYRHNTRSHNGCYNQTKTLSYGGWNGVRVPCDTLPKSPFWSGTHVVVGMPSCLAKAFPKSPASFCAGSQMWSTASVTVHRLSVSGSSCPFLGLWLCQKSVKVMTPGPQPWVPDACALGEVCFHARIRNDDIFYFWEFVQWCQRTTMALLSCFEGKEKKSQVNCFVVLHT